MSCFALLTENISLEIKPQCVWVCVCVFSLIYWLQVFKQNLSILKRIEVKFSGHFFPCSPTILPISPPTYPVLFLFSFHSPPILSHPSSVLTHSPSVPPSLSLCSSPVLQCSPTGLSCSPILHHYPALLQFSPHSPLFYTSHETGQ